MNKRNSEVENPYLSRIEFLNDREVRSNPTRAVVDAIWKLIKRNSMPPQPPPSFSLRAGAERLNPIQDVFVQTFYVVFPSTATAATTFAYVNHKEVAQHIIKKMINDPNHAFDPYFISKIGAVAWREASNLDEEAASQATDAEDGVRNRLQAALNVFLVEVMLVPVERKRDFPARVVGRESLAVEVSRLRESEDPRVLALIQVLGDAYVNPHLRESQKSRDNNNDNICILEGRTLRFFIIGSHVYDDIQVERMPEDEWYALKVIVPDLGSIYLQGRIQFILEDSSGVPVPSTTGRLNSWTLRSDENGWQFSIQAGITQPNTRLQQIEGVPEMSPTIMIVGRVLPRNTRSMPPNLESYLSTHGLTATSGIEMEEGLFLYADENEEAFLLNPAGTKKIQVSNAIKSSKGHQLTNNFDVDIDGVAYTWRAENIADTTVGWLEKREPTDADVHTIRVQKRPEDTFSLLIGRQHQNEATAYSAFAIFPNNPDRYLGQTGNLLIRYIGRTAGKRTFRFTLLETKNELPFLFKQSGRHPWRVIGWPVFTEQQYKIEDVDIVGEKNEIIFGTTYYRMKTSGTLPW